MNRGEAIATDDAIEFGEHFLHRDCISHIVTGCENMGGIEANADSFRLSHVRDDERDLFEGVTQTRTLTGGRFQRDLGF